MFVLIAHFVMAFNNTQSITNNDVVEKIKILDSLGRNFLVSSSNYDFHNINKIEYYAYNLFEEKLHKVSWVEQNSDHEILFVFFKELYFKNNDKLSLLFSCFDYYTSKYSELLKNSAFPEYLMLLPAVLTGYNYKYTSSEGAGIWRMNYASGIWGKLKINDCFDERYHTFKSTVVALRYMEHLRALYKDFDYALCAFLSSPVAVNNWVKYLKQDKRFLDLISKDVYLDFHFYKTMVFLYYMREELEIFAPVLTYTTKTDSVFVSKRFHFEPIVSGINISKGEFEFLNSQYKFNYSKDSNYIVIPSRLVQTFRNKESEIIYQNDSIYFPKKVENDSLVESVSENVYHTVKKGETLSHIARKYKGVTIEDIVRLNGLKSADKVKDGMRLIIIKNQ